MPFVTNSMSDTKYFSLETPYLYLGFYESTGRIPVGSFQIRENEKSHMCLRKGKRLIPNEVHCLRFQVFPIHPIFLTLTSFLMLHHFTEGIKTKRIKENVFFFIYNSDNGQGRI